MEKVSSRKILRRIRRINAFDGQHFKQAMLAGAAWLEEHCQAINALNVFPVPDGDTGSNMAATMRSAVRNVKDSDEISASMIAAQVAHDALLGARGNSGVILSQVLRGIAVGLDQKQTFTAQDLAAALQHAVQLAYRAVMQPIEGTILTVVRETAEAAQRCAAQHDDLMAQMQAIVTAARQAVARTPELLPILKQAGVVDAGGQGLCTILEGMLRYMQGEVTIPITMPTSTAAHQPAQLDAYVKKGRVTIEENFGYEVVFLLRGHGLDVEHIRQTIIDMGGVSTVVAGDESMLKVHTHTPTPGKILDYGVSLGSLLDINIENLQEQSLNYAAESAVEHAQDSEEDNIPVISHISTVAVVAGKGFERVFAGLNVNTIVSGGQTMNPSIEDLVTAVEQAPTPQVIILPNNSNVTLSAQQVVGLTHKEVYVVPSKTLPQGIAALISFNFEADFVTNCQTMTQAINNIQTAEITTAVRSVQLDGVDVHEGDFIGLINGRLAVAGQHVPQVMHDTLQHMSIENYEIITLYYGKDVTAEQAEQVAQEIRATYPQLEIEVFDGSQPHYIYILSAE
jgi:uncharacterized protein